ncbi:MAG: ABC transporter ATP-binding protein [Clostridia bacterium]|nr:ABC transporter ATP-binding protein [Clostridia bacterium]
MLKVENLSVAYGDLTILKDVSFSLEPGEWLMIVGPNGAGKSTLINAITGGVPAKGDVIFEGRNTRTMKPHELARGIGVLAQSHFVGYSFSVEEVVRLGRYAYAPSIFSRHSGEEDAVRQALEQTGMWEQRRQSVLTLSGGELQRTFLAQTFCQDPRLLLLDEPTNHLDLVYQKQVFELIQDWLKQKGRAVVSVVHDLSLARAYGTRALLLDRGQVVADGPMDTVFSNEILDRVYRMDVRDWMLRMLDQWKEA